MNKQSKDGNISWTDYTWNPIKGLCPVGCWYCYSRVIYKRFKMNPHLWLDTSELHAPSRIKKPRRIFVCSTFEFFHPVTKTAAEDMYYSQISEMRELVFKEIENNPQHTFQILTKMPENIDRPMPDNVWLGVSVTGEDSRGDLLRSDDLMDTKAKNKFISFEPMLDFMDTCFLGGWLILGRLTGHGHKHDPPRYWIKEMVKRAREQNTPIFLKNNLKEIWGKKLIQEFPE